MYKALIDNEVDPWALNVEQEDAFGSFIFKLFKIDKIGDPDQELYFFNMLTTTSPSFIESKTQTILNKACQNFAIFESRIRYLYLSDPETFFNVLVKKLTSFKDLPRSCDVYMEVKSIFQIIDQTMNSSFMSKIPKMDFNDLCMSYDEVIRKKINKQKEIKTAKDKAKTESDKGRKSKLWEKFNDLTTEVSEIKICWSDSMFHYLIHKTNNYPSLEKSLDLLIEIIQKKIIAIIEEYDEKTSNINIFCWSLESLVAFLAELTVYDISVAKVLSLVNAIVLGEQSYSKISVDVRFKIGLRFCAHAKDSSSLIKILNDLLPTTSSSIYMFMFNDLSDRLKIPVMVQSKPEEEPKMDEVEPFEHISYQDLMKVGLNDFLDDLTYDIELKFKNGFSEAQICHRYVYDIINLECLTGTGEKMTFKEGHKKHIKTLVLNERINKLLPRNSLKKAQQKIRMDFKGVDGMNDVRYIINNVGRALTDKIRNNKKN